MVTLRSDRTGLCFGLFPDEESALVWAAERLPPDQISYQPVQLLLDREQIEAIEMVGLYNGVRRIMIPQISELTH